MSKKYKLKIVLIITVFSYIGVYSQELLKNGSFEEFENNHTLFKFYAKNWFIPNGSSVDYYSTKFKNKFSAYNVPDNAYGYHNAHNGEAYSGLVVFSWVACDYELLTGSLKKPLKKDTLYQISFSIKYAGDSILLYSKVIDVYFTKDNHSLSMSGLSSGNYNKYAKEIGISIKIEETYKQRDWVRVKGIFKAKGGERYITIGLISQGENSVKNCEKFSKLWGQSNLIGIKNFIEKNEIYPIGINSNFSAWGYLKYRSYSYYFIDAVSLLPADDRELDFTIHSDDSHL